MIDVYKRYDPEDNGAVIEEAMKTVYPAFEVGIVVTSEAKAEDEDEDEK